MSSNTSNSDLKQVVPDELIGTKKWEDIKDESGKISIRREIVDTLYSNGCRFPTPIQEKSLIYTLSGRDAVCRSKAGSGKTLAYVIPALNRVEDTGKLQVIITAHTHELCQQIISVVNEYAKNIPWMKNTVFGAFNVNYNDQTFIARIKSRMNIMVGLPSTIYTILSEYLKPDSVKLLVLDEADFYFNENQNQSIKSMYGYVLNTTKLVKKYNPNAQTILMSATMTRLPSLMDYITNYMRNPQMVSGNENNVLTLENMVQFVARATDSFNKVNLLIDILKKTEFTKCIIFCREKKSADKLYELLVEAYDKSGVLVSHGDCDKEVRQKVAHEFRTGARARVLITTNLFERGIDVPEVNLVINFDCPEDSVSFIQRSGRGGRFGRKAVTVTIFVQPKGQSLKDCEEFIMLKEINDKLKSSGSTKMEIYKGEIPRKYLF